MYRFSFYYFDSYICKKYDVILPTCCCINILELIYLITDILKIVVFNYG